jgi:hypothetical protein
MGKKGCENMRFCETNRIYGDVFFDVTVCVDNSCSDTLEKMNRVRVVKPIRFFAAKTTWRFVRQPALRSAG